MTFLRSMTTRVSAFAVGMFYAGSAWAQLFGPVPDVGGTTGDVRSVVIDILKRVLEFMALIAVIFIVIAGIRLVVSQGDEGAKDTAKKTILYVIVGLVIIVLARTIVEFIADALGV